MMQLPASVTVRLVKINRALTPAALDAPPWEAARRCSGCGCLGPRLRGKEQAAGLSCPRGSLGLLGLVYGGCFNLSCTMS